MSGTNLLSVGRYSNSVLNEDPVAMKRARSGAYGGWSKPQIKPNCCPGQDSATRLILGRTSLQCSKAGHHRLPHQQCTTAQRWLRLSVLHAVSTLVPSFATRLLLGRACVLKFRLRAARTRTQSAQSCRASVPADNARPTPSSKVASPDCALIWELMEPYANVRAMGLTLIKRFVFLGEVLTHLLCAD